MALLGSAPAAVRFFTALAQCAAMVVAGLMARELGGGRGAQIVAALAVAVSPVSMSAGHLFQYVSFDLLWSVLAVYFVIRLLESGDGRWWIAVGAAIGLGLMTRYTIAWLVAGLAVGFLLTPARRLLMSGWLIAGAAVALVIVLPNLIWQASHGFISLDFLRSIHARDIRIGRTDGFLWKQLLVPANLFTIPLWIAGLFFYFRKPAGRALPRRWDGPLWQRWPCSPWSSARDYYTAPLYPMLLAAGAVMWEQWPRWARGLNWAGTGGGAWSWGSRSLPVAPINSRWFEAAIRVNGDLREEIGWPELGGYRRQDPRLTARGRARRLLASLPATTAKRERSIFTGPRMACRKPLSRVNSFWLRGYGDHPPQTLIVVGLSPRFVENNFASCESEGTISNRYGVANEETEDDKYLWVCRGLREPWPEFWREIRAWG